MYPKKKVREEERSLQIFPVIILHYDNQVAVITDTCINHRLVPAQVLGRLDFVLFLYKLKTSTMLLSARTKL